MMCDTDKEYYNALCPFEQHVYDISKKYHDGQVDDEGNDYFTSHVLHVVSIVKQVTSDLEMIATAYLHDVIEDTNMTYEELCTYFATTTIPDMVMELTHDGQKDKYGYYFPRLKSEKCIIIKFADRLSNLSRMSCWSEERRKQYLKKSKFWKDGTDK
jgi:GTP pyrophosphokinase